MTHKALLWTSFALLTMGVSAGSEPAPWSLVGPGSPFPRSPTTLDLVPGPPDTVYAGTAYDGVYRSIDSGLTWTQVGPAYRCRLVVADPSDAARVYLVADEGAFGSEDFGATWSQAEAGGALIPRVAVFSVDAQGRAYAATSGGIVWALDDEGVWSRLSETPLPPIRSLAAAPSATDILYAGTRDGVWRSDDAGRTWRRAGADLVQTGGWQPAARWIAVHPSDPEVVVSTADYDGRRAAYLTEDGGATWRAIAVGGPSDVLFDAIGNLYVADRSILRSADGGATWDTLRAGLSYSLGLGGMAADSLRRLYTVTGREEMQISIDDGRTWAPQVSSDVAIHGLAVHPASPHPTYILGNSAVYRAAQVSEATSWQDWDRIPLPDAVDGTSGGLWADALVPDAVYVSHPSPGNSALWVLRRLRWQDGAPRWVELLVTPRVDDLAVDPRDPQTVTIVATGRVFTTHDGGMTWAEGSQLVPEQVTGLVRDANLYASTSAGVYVSRDTSATWQATSTQVAFSTIARSPHTGWLYAAHTDVRQSVILVSADHGSTWSTLPPLPRVRPTSEGPAPPGVQSILFDPDDPTALFAVTPQMGVFGARDGGGWDRVSPGVMTARSPYGLGYDEMEVARVRAAATSPSGHVLVGARRGIYVRSAFRLEPSAAQPDTGGSEPADPDLTRLRWRFLGPSVVVADQFRLGTAVSVLEESPADPDVIYVATPSGRLYRVRRGGGFEPVEGGLPGSEVFDLAADPVTGRMFAGTSMRGVYVLETSPPAARWVPWNGNVISTSVWGVGVTPTGHLIAALKRQLLVTDTGSQEWTGPEATAEFRSITTHPQRGDWALAVAADGGIYRTVDAGQTWTYIGGGGAKNAVVTGSGSRLVALTRDGRLLSSEVDQIAWRQIEPPTVNAVSLRTSPEGDRLLLGGRGTVFASDDDGQTWVPVGRGLPDALVVDLLQHPDEDEVLYAATGHGLFTTDPLADPETTDLQRFRAAEIGDVPATARWRLETPVATQKIHASLVDTGLVVVRHLGRQLRREGDGSWIAAGDDSVRIPSFGPVRFSEIGYLHDYFGWDRWLDGWDDFRRLGLAKREIAIDARNPRVQYYGRQGALMKSDDGGQRWQRVRPPEYGRYLALAVDPSHPLTLYAGSNDSRLTGVFRSRDGGATFESVAPGVVSDIEVSWSRPGEVWAVLGGGIFRSPDRGASWQALGAPKAEKVKVLRIAVSSSDVLYAVTGSGVYISRDAAATWTKVDRGLPLEDVRDIAIHPVHAMTAYAATGSGVYSLNATVMRVDVPADVTQDSVVTPDTPSPPDTTSTSEEELGTDQGPLPPLVTALHPAYPNPSRGDLTIAFDLAEAASVHLSIYDVLGQPVYRLALEQLAPGKHEVPVSLGGSGSGVWIARLRVGDRVFVEKVLVIR